MTNPTVRIKLNRDMIHLLAELGRHFDAVGDRDVAEEIAQTVVMMVGGNDEFKRQLDALEAKYNEDRT